MSLEDLDVRRARAALPRMDVAARLTGLQADLDRLDPACDAVLITHLTNIRYLTGFTGSAALLLVTPDSALLVTDGRYEEQAAGELEQAGVPVHLEIGRTVAVQRQALVGASAAHGRLGLEAEQVTWADQQRYEREWFPDVELVPTHRVVEARRAVKDEGEVARIELACAIADAALASMAPHLEAGPTEAGFASELDGAMRRLGADDVSFETIVASGPNGSRPHHLPSGRVVSRGDLVVIDFGALVDGYHSDMTRTLAVGGADALDATQRRMVEVVRASQAAGVAAVAPGVPTGDVDRACREVIVEAGWGDAFVHGTGHGVGLDIHEDPRVPGTGDATLDVGHVVTVEPGVYLPGHGGVRVEDTVVVTPAGRRTLTRSPKS
ncbi:MAG: aminopeptidase P family protein [Acidimicrobiales bacterium]|nr:aminopeptidase P family protein [Acidimicrobiales bacterium]